MNLCGLIIFASLIATNLFDSNIPMEPTYKKMQIRFHKPQDVHSLLVDSDNKISKGKYTTTFEYLFDSKYRIACQSFLVVNNPIDKKTYITPGIYDIYIFNKNDVLACNMSVGGSFYIVKSLFCAVGSIDQVVDNFLSSICIKDINKKLLSTPKIDLASAAPSLFFTAGSTGGSRPVIPTINSFEIENNILKINILSDGNVFSGDFWIDIKNNKIIRSVIDGVEMKLNTGKMFASPIGDR